MAGGNNFCSPDEGMIKISKQATRLKETPEENYRAMIKKGPVSVKTSLKELEDDFKMNPEWEMIKEGRFLSIPVEELRMENHSG